MNPKKPVILAVDDEPFNLDLIVRTLGFDYEVHRAASGEEALRILSQLDELAVIITDQRMPGISGTEFLKLARLQRPEAVRIIVTGYTSPEDLIDAINSSNVYRFLTKPWNMTEFRAAVRRAARLAGAGGGELICDVTGLPNRGLLHLELDREVARAVRFRRPLAVLACAITGYAEYAALAGRMAAEDLVSGLADFLRPRIRVTDTLAYWREGVFVAILPECTLPEGIAERLVQDLDQSDPVRKARERHLNLGLRCVVRSLPEEVASARQLLKMLEESLRSESSQPGRTVVPTT